VCDYIDFVYGEQASFVVYPFYYIVGTHDIKRMTEETSWALEDHSVVYNVMYYHYVTNMF